MSDLDRVLEKLDRLGEAISDLRADVAVVRDRDERNARRLTAHGERLDQLDKDHARAKGYVAAVGMTGGALGAIGSKLASIFG